MLQKWHLGFKTWKYTPTERGFDSHLGYYAGSTDYYTQDSLCWPDSQCFTSFTPTHEPVSGWDLHRDRETIRNSTLYSTTLYLPLILHRGLYAPVCHTNIPCEKTYLDRPKTVAFNLARLLLRDLKCITWVQTLA